MLLTTIFVLASAVPALAASGSAPLDQWSVCYQATRNDHTPQINGIAYGNNTFVALSGSEALTSPDGAHWTVQQNANLEGVGSITFDNSLFVAVGAKILTSPDGANWTERVANINQNPNVFQDLLAVTYGNGVFVAVGQGGVIMTSPDGITWITQSADTTDYLSGVAYGNGTFVVIGDTGLNPDVPSVFTSPDGVSWKETDLQEQEGCNGPVAHGDNTFVAFGTSAAGYCLKASADGVNWTDDRASVSSPIEALAFGGNTFLAVEQNAGSCTMLTSTDGVNWTAYDAGIDFYPQAVSYGDNTFVATGSTNNENGDPHATIIQSAPLSGAGGQSSPTIQPSQGSGSSTSNPSSPSNSTVVPTIMAKFVVGHDYYYTGPEDTQTAMDAAPYIDAASGRTLVPVRYLGEALGAQTTWDATTQTVTLTKGSTTISMVIGSTTLIVNGQAQKMDQAPVINGGRTFRRMLVPGQIIKIRMVGGILWCIMVM